MIVYCEIIKWTYGEHHYGFLTCGSNQKQLEGDITQSEADRINRRDSLPPSAMYEAGEVMEKFFSEEKLKEAAIAQYKTLFPGATALIGGSDVDPDPQPIWDGPYQDEAEALIAEMGVYYDNPEVLDEIRGDWEDILAHLGG